MYKILLKKTTDILAKTLQSSANRLPVHCTETSMEGKTSLTVNCTEVKRCCRKECGTNVAEFGVYPAHTFYSAEIQGSFAQKQRNDSQN